MIENCIDEVFEMIDENFGENDNHGNNNAQDDFSDNNLPILQYSKGKKCVIIPIFTKRLKICLQILHRLLIIIHILVKFPVDRPTASTKKVMFGHFS